MPKYCHIKELGLDNYNHSKGNLKQESIQVGCVLPRLLTGSGVGAVQRGEVLSGGRRGLSITGSDIITHASETITSPQTSFAGDRNGSVACRSDSTSGSVPLFIVIFV